MEDEPDQLITPTPGGRIYESEQRALLGDCAPSGRMRLDAIARWLQDVAYSDVLDGEVADLGFWVLRRTRIVVERFPRFPERCRVSTFCSGVGRMWAQRRSTIWAWDQDWVPIVEAVALWIHLDPRTRMPTPLTEAELALFGESARHREVSRRLRHPRPTAAASSAAKVSSGSASAASEWWFRESDCDVADHINNAAYWEPLEEELIRRERSSGETVSAIDAEVEFRNAAQPGRKLLLADGERRWLVEPSAADATPDANAGEVYASTVLRKIRTTSGSN